MHIRLLCCPFAGLTHNDIHLLPGFSDNLFNTCWMNTPIKNKLGECDACYLASYWNEAREHNSFWSIVDDQINTRGRFQGTNVASFTSDDAPLHLVIRQLYDGDNC